MHRKRKFRPVFVLQGRMGNARNSQVVGSKNSAALQPKAVVELADASTIAEIGHVNGKVECRERLGGLLHYYYRDAA